MLSPSTQPIRLVFLLQDLLFGGTQRHTLELAARLDPKRFAPEIWTLAGGKDFAPKAREYGLRVVDLRPRGPVGPSALLALWRRLGREPVDMLSLMTVVPNIWGRLFGRLRGAPRIIANCRGIADLPKQHERFLRHMAHRHICNAQAIKQRLVERYRLPGERIAVIPNGVDAAYYRPAPPSPGLPLDKGQSILCVARMTPEKDLPTLIAAFAGIGARHPDATLSIVGDGPLRASIEALLSRSGLGTRIRLLPGTSDLRPHFAGASIFALSSSHEGLPNVILEAMACGLPVAATRAGGVPELVAHGKTGLLSPAGDAQALASNLDRLLVEPGLGRIMGEEGRKRVLERHSLEAMTRAHEELFSSEMERARKG